MQSFGGQIHSLAHNLDLNKDNLVLCESNGVVQMIIDCLQIHLQFPGNESRITPGRVKLYCVCTSNTGRNSRDTAPTTTPLCERVIVVVVVVVMVLMHVMMFMS